MSALQAVRYAWGRALAVMFSSLFVLLFYLVISQMGPGIEGKFFPIIKNYKLTNITVDPNGGFSFVPKFEKVRDCTYYGITWFSPDENGNLSRIQGRREEETNSPPQTGPVGPRTGIKQSLVPSANATSIFGIMHHDCGFIWQTRTTIGPFLLRDILPANLTGNENGKSQRSADSSY